MNIWTLVGAIGFPPVAALHAYSVEYGYRGVTRAEAWGKAKSVLIGAATTDGATLLTRRQ